MPVLMMPVLIMIAALALAAWGAQRLFRWVNADGYGERTPPAPASMPATTGDGMPWLPYSRLERL